MLALEKQLRFELKRFHATQNSIETLFIGGGTPSTVSPKLYEPIFTLLKPYLTQECEITTEANPNSATKEWLEGMFALGVNRVSFGVQSFDAQKLKLLNRAHTPQMAKDAITHASKVGFKNISLDLIYATKGDTKALLENDLKEAFALPINHLSAYALTIEEGTVFEKKPAMAAEQLSLTQWLFDKISAHGFKQYEISNFGAYHSKHNIGYWRYKDYIGVGAGAVGKYQEQRFYPTSEIESYIKDPLNIQTELLNEEDIHLEKIFLGVRSLVGIHKDELTPHELQQAQILTQENKLIEKEAFYYNPDYLLADEIALFLTS